VGARSGSAPSESLSTTTSSSDPRDSVWLERAVAAVERNSLWALTALMLIAGVLLLYMGVDLRSSTTIGISSLTTTAVGPFLLAAHVGNISIFRSLFIRCSFIWWSQPLRGLPPRVIVLHLLCGPGFCAPSRRIPRVPALLAAPDPVPRCCLGRPPVGFFKLATCCRWLVVCGVVLLERKGRWSEIAAMLCVLVAAGSSSLVSR